jgi:formylglycine-generating enzyme required for sulfatase activity/serine/threonine protein kinase
MPHAPTPAPGEPDPGQAQESLAQRLRGLYGEGVDPGISLEGEHAAPGDASAEIVRRLNERSGGFGRYRLKDELARGGQGSILRVWDEDLRRSLAMKVILGKDDQQRGPSPLDTRSVGRFLEEAQVTGQLDHPGIVPVHELGVDSQGRVYFTMKLVRGRDFKSILKLVHEGQEGWTVTRALHVLLRVCEAMAYAHSKGVIHRDLKPGNVMVGRFGEVYVMDWGLARVLGRPDRKDVRVQRPEETTQTLNVALHEKGSLASDAPILTMDGDVVGTPAYMSPEQAAGEIEKMGPHSDVYSAGAMLYHLLAKQLPYVAPGVKLSNYAIWYRVQEGPPTPLHELAPDQPAELIAICEKAMARDPARRYRDMSELGEDLRAFLEQRVVGAYETGALAELRKWVQRNRPLAASLAAAIVLALVGLGGIGYVEARSRRTEEGLRRVAEENEQVARRERNNVLRLSAFRVLEDLEAEAERLWPPYPQHIPAYLEWLQRAEGLIAGLEQATDDYPGHARQLEILRARALPSSPEDRVAARRTHPRFEEFEALSAQLASLRLARSVQAGAAAPEPPLLDQVVHSLSAAALNNRAWPLVDPERRLFGRELEGLVLSRLAVARASDDTVRAEAGDTLAWALLSVGLDDEALEAGHAALSAAPAHLKGKFKELYQRLERAVLLQKGGALDRQIERLEPELAKLEEHLSRAGRWRFASPDDQAWHDQLAKLVELIEAFRHPDLGPARTGMSPRWGWGIERRLAFARRIEERSLTSTEARARWEEACASIADRNECPRYAGLRLTPQLGLLPLRLDLDTGLWEFVQLVTGDEPKFDSKGLELSESSGVVMVLIPGGTFAMGAQNLAPEMPGYDPAATPYEGPVHQVSLSPFFLSKYELTQAQWMRMAGSNPSFIHGQDDSPLHPVESISWLDCQRVLERAGLTLPTEAQWEYSARAGTDMPWWTGAEKDSLAGRVNLLGTRLNMHAPVQRHDPNPFGLASVLGNVWEWCADNAGKEVYLESDSLDPRFEVGGRERIARGGSFSDAESYARVSYRLRVPDYFLNQNMGVRPARPVEP